MIDFPEQRTFIAGHSGGGKSYASTIAILTAQQRGIKVRALSINELKIADHLRSLESFKPFFAALDEVKK